MFVHPTSLKTALGAAKRVGLEPERIVMFMEAKPTVNVGKFINIDTLVQGMFVISQYNPVINVFSRTEGLSAPARFQEKRLAPGENKTKIAFYSFSR